EPTPTLPSNHSEAPQSVPPDTNSTTTASPQAPSSLQEAQRAADIAIALAVAELKRPKASKTQPIDTPRTTPTPFQARKFKPESRTQKELRLKNASKAPSAKQRPTQMSL